MGKMKDIFIDERNAQDNREVPRDFIEYTEPCTDDRRWNIEQKLEEWSG